MIHRKMFADWSPAIQTKLREATFGPDLGMMHGTCAHNPETFVILDEKDDVMGWALISNRYFGFKHTAMFFTQPKLRRRGIGRMLAEEVKKHYPDAHTEGWDSASLGFFKHVGMVRPSVYV